MKRRRQDMGIPFVSEYARLTLAELDACCHPWLPQLPADCYVMGVDVGHKEFQVIVRGHYKGFWYLYEAARVAGKWVNLEV